MYPMYLTNDPNAQMTTFCTKKKCGRTRTYRVFYRFVFSLGRSVLPGMRFYGSTKIATSRISPTETKIKRTSTMTSPYHKYKAKQEINKKKATGTGTIFSRVHPHLIYSRQAYSSRDTSRERALVTYVDRGGKVYEYQVSQVEEELDDSMLPHRMLPTLQRSSAT